MYTLELTVNGVGYKVEVEASTNLLEVLRDKLGITSPKVGCETGDCGTCSVIMNGKLVKSCITNALMAQGADVLTVEVWAGRVNCTPCRKLFTSTMLPSVAFAHRV